MCGIVGYVGKGDAKDILLNGLESLEYRGYDSCGIAFINNGKIEILKEKGRIKDLRELTKDLDVTNLGIGHTRWATHGVPNKINAHPHKVGSITLVHNGIIENYNELKKELKDYYDFLSDTDSEVACALIDFLYHKDKDIIKAINDARKRIRGSYAFGIIVDGDDKIYAVRKDSPLIVALLGDGNSIASDVPAILQYTNKYMLLEEGEIAIISSSSVTILGEDNKVKNKDILTFNGSMEDACKGGYECFMIKEINDEPQTLKDTMEQFISDGMNSLSDKLSFLDKYKEIAIVACGSAYHAGLIGKSLIEEYANIPVSVEIASEYRYKHNFYSKDKLCIVISQSGETADTLASLRLANQNGMDTLGIVNVYASSIARECKEVIYTKAGCEIAVATTKAYSSQVAVLILIALYLGRESFNSLELDKIFDDLKKMPSYVKEVIDKVCYLKIAQDIHKSEHAFLIGRGVDYALAMEGALKLKEVSYIHTEAYAAGELKHGTLALIDKGTPVFAINSVDEIREKTVSNIKEVITRGANVILITKDNKDFYMDEVNYTIKIREVHKLVEPLLMLIPMQIIGYYCAKLLGRDIDKPKNLAKSVTVE